MAICCVFGCTNQTHIKRKSGVTFHRFPGNETLKKQWIKTIRREHWQPSRYTVICSEHFDEKFINRTSACGRVELRDGAIPTIFPSYPPHLQPSTKKVRKPPRPRGSNDSGLILSGEVKTEAAGAEVMEGSEPSTKDTAIQVRKPPRPRKSNDSSGLILSGEVKTEAAGAEAMEVSEPSTKDIAIQANDLTLVNKVAELQNKNLHLEWKFKQLEMRLSEKSQVIKNLRKQNQRLNLRISSVIDLLEKLD